MKVIAPTTDDDREELLRGRVMAERICDVVAKPGTKRHDHYLRYLRDGYMGEHAIDPNDQYRESDERLRLIERALDAYELRHGVEVTRGRIYLHTDFPIGSAPHAVESDLIVLQVHTRQSIDTYLRAVESGPDTSMLRVSWAQMAVTGCRFALHLDYYEDAETKVRKLHEHVVQPDRFRMEQLLESLQIFAAKSRFMATDDMRKAG